MDWVRNPLATNEPKVQVVLGQAEGQRLEKDWTRMALRKLRSTRHDIGLPKTWCNFACVSLSRSFGLRKIQLKLMNHTVYYGQKILRCDALVKQSKYLSIGRWSTLPLPRILQNSQSCWYSEVRFGTCRVPQFKAGLSRLVLPFEVFKASIWAAQIL